MVSMGALISGQTLQNGRYSIIDMVGQGGMGYVYKASDNVKGGLVVAIKEMIQNGLSSESLRKERQLFQKEADILQQLTLTPYPHIPQYYDRFTDQGRDFIVMEFIAGKTLQTKLNQSLQQQLPVSRVVDYGIQICRTLAYLHQQSPPVILRDLKPGNVMVTDNNDVYLLDFGIARKYKPEKIRDTTIRLTPEYAAPEAFFGNTEPRSDLYSLGALLYRCLTGRTPDNNNPLDPPRQPLQSVREFNAQVSPQLNTLIQHMVAFYKISRPASATIVLRTLEAIESGTASTTEPLTFHALPTLKPYSYWLLAHAYQLRFASMQSKSLLNLPGLGLAKFLHFCSEVGSWFEVFLSPPVVAQWHNLRHIGGNIQQQRSARSNGVAGPPPPEPAGPGNTLPVAPTPRPFLQRNKLVKVILDNSATIAYEWRNPARQKEATSPNVLPFIGVFASIFFCVIAMLSLLHLSSYVAIFLLAAIVVVLCFHISTQQNVEKSVHHIFMTIMLAALFVCIALIAQPDVRNMLVSISVNLLLCLLTGLFVLTSLFRSAERNLWEDRFAVLLIAIACATQQYLLGPQELQSLVPAIAATAISIIIAGVLLLSVFFLALFRLQRPYATGFIISISSISCIAMPLQLTFGKQDLPASIQYALHAQLNLAAVIFSGILIVFISVAHKCFMKAAQVRSTQEQSRQTIQNGNVAQTNRTPWERLGRMPLALIIIPCLLLQYFLGTTYTRQSSDDVMQLLKIRPLDSAHINLAVVALLVLIAGMLWLSWLRRCDSAIIKTLASVGIGGVCLLLPATLWKNNTMLASMSLNTNLVPALAWLVTTTLLLLAISALLQLNPVLSQFIHRLIHVSRYAILTLSNLLCVLYYLAYSNQLPILNYSLPIQDFQVTIGQLALIFMVIPFLIALIFLFYHMLQLLLHPFTPDNRQNWTLQPWERGRKLTRQGVSNFFKGWLYGALLCSLLFITCTTVEWSHYTFSPLPAMLAQTSPHLPLAIWLLACGLLLIAGFAFFKLQLRFEAIKYATSKLFFVLALIINACASVCMLLMSLGIWTTFFTLLFAALEIVCLMLLIQTVLLITWAEKERAARERQQHN